MNYISSRLKRKRMKKLANLQKCQIQAILLNNGIKDISGPKKVLIQRVVDNETFYKKIKRKLTPAASFILGIVLTTMVGTLIEIPINRKQNQNFGDKILKWDEKDERINNIYRISKKVLDTHFPFGYKLYATNPKVVLPASDTIFSNSLGGNIDAYVHFDEDDTISIQLVINMIQKERINDKVKLTELIQDVNILRPPVGFYREISGVNMNGIALYFGLLDDTPNDEIYVLGYKKHGSPKEYTDYRRKTGLR